MACRQKAQQDLERWKELEVETIRVTERERVQRETMERRRQVMPVVSYGNCHVGCYIGFFKFVAVANIYIAMYCIDTKIQFKILTNPIFSTLQLLKQPLFNEILAIRMTAM